MSVEKESLLILGAGELGQAVAEMAVATGKYDKISFLDDNPSSEKEKYFPIVGTIEDLFMFVGRFSNVISAFGNNQIRYSIRTKAKEFGFKLPSIIHASAVVSPLAIIKEGVIIREKVAISHKVVIEEGCLINMGVLIDHCCFIGHDTHLPMGVIVRNEIHIPEMSTFVPGQVIE